jgi:hypothetical protein
MRKQFSLAIAIDWMNYLFYLLCGGIAGSHFDLGWRL